MTYSYKNSRGETFYAYQLKKDMYFFKKKLKKNALKNKPTDREVFESTTGYPMFKRIE